MKRIGKDGELRLNLNLLTANPLMRKAKKIELDIDVEGALKKVVVPVPLKELMKIPSEIEKVHKLFNTS